ncbi:L,D-transpeptidase [Pullulanibacillus sp. KACC 23026]|uniref:L,D-transpeptidase n=1 Tax=Pullulanibacillus sp. KACC 23026 TaxID=3028315 RepID=UPI0023B18376|nr:L,D-transpeptidase [Pullulanibacillus sp. KACC 23026]WEG11953.1 L,D-transpeptidase [Pullulanibacillus sp. KACC 23026]
MLLKKTSYSLFGLILISLLLSGCGINKSSNAADSSKKEVSTQKAHASNSTSKKAEQAKSLPTTKELEAGKVNITKLTNKQWEKLIAGTNFMGPSDGPYPTLEKGEDVWIDADTTKERVYIMNGNKVIYTMLTSSGIDTEPDTSTPEGTFYVQAEKGLTFFSASEQEGANYWTSWKNHGEFLFHSIPIDKDGNYIQSEAEKLGQKASHGCFRLPVDDAKWIYENIPEGTKVVIHS